MYAACDAAFPHLLTNAVQNVEFLNNPARFLDPYHFRVTFECIAPLPEGTRVPTSCTHTLSECFDMVDLEWRLIYVGSAKSEEYDQELDSCMG